MSQELFNLKRDGQIVKEKVTMVDVLAYIHKTHSFSVSHAIANEGYELVDA